MPKPSQKAFTLVEITISLGLVAFAMIALLGIFSGTFKTAAESQEEAASALIARDLIAKLRSPFCWQGLGNNPDLSAISGGYALKDLAASSTAFRTTVYYDSKGKRVDTTTPNDNCFFGVDLEFVPALAMGDMLIGGPDPKSLAAQKNCLLARILISRPIKAPEAARQKVEFTTIVTQTGD
jgi:type II secretory pathway pseudopilin PulG